MSTRERTTTASPAERLLALERGIERRSRALHRLTTAQREAHDEARRLRMSFSAGDAALYQTLASMRQDHRSTRG